VSDLTKCSIQNSTDSRLHSEPKRSSTVSESTFSAVVGLSVISWSALGLIASEGVENITSVRICITVLHLAVGVCFLIRSPLVKSGTLRGTAATLPSLLICGIAFAVAPPANTWSLAAQFIFACGTFVAVVSVFTLGRSFAVLPALREIVATGPYHFVRHPIYFGEMLMVVGCFIAKPTGLTLLPLLVALPCLVVRVLAEESLLRESERYRDYARRVPWRLIPGVW